MFCGRSLRTHFLHVSMPGRGSPNSLIFSAQAEYEVTPDEKRKECGQHLIDSYLNPQVSK